ncbi:MAG: molybdopterin cofactor-binding domain-containing protein, partial [Pseudomonadota bacterium]
NGKPFEGFVNEMMPIPGWADQFAEKAFFRVADMMHMQMTGGSTAVRFTGWDNMRQAGATARAMLMRAAANQLGVSVASLHCADGVVTHSESNRSLRYGELAADAAALRPEQVPTKSPDAYRFIGHSIAREDIPRKVFAEEQYGIDYDVPGMQYAAIRHANVFGARISRIRNENAIRARRGVNAVRLIENGVAVIADNPWRAEQAARALDISVQQHANSSLSSDALEQAQRDALAGELTEAASQGDVTSAFATANRTLQAEYFVPYLAHATMEPLNATVWREGGRLHVACGVQNPLLARAHVAKVAGLELDDVVLHALPMGGGFGRRVGFSMTGDVPLNWLTDAVQTALAHDAPVKTTWSREEDTRNDVYRPMVLGQFEAALDHTGMPTAWRSKTFLPENDVRAVQPPYAIANQRVAFAGSHQAVPTGFWRAVEHSQHGFFKESFIDEIAVAAGRDPLAYRLALLDPASAEAVTLRKVADMAAWQHGARSDGRAMGCAVVQSFGSAVAQIAEVSRSETGVRVHRVWCAVDCGVVVNPQAARAQVEGAIHFALSAALYGKCDVQQGGVVQSNFHDYRVVTLRDAARVEVELLTSNNPIGGVGEIGVPPLAPAVCNALAVLGDRPRRLPVVA